MKKLGLIIGLATLLTSFTSGTFNASFYADKYHGRKSADGTVFSQNKLTCASNKHKLGDSLRVTNSKNGKSVDVKVTDRLHPKYGHRIDLSKRAFKQIAELKSGVVPVEIEKL